MSARDCLLVTFSDSDNLGVVDMVSGDTNVVEIPHFESLYSVGVSGASDKPYIRFDGDGGRTAKYAGDGKLDSEANDFGPASIYNSAPYLNSAGKFTWEVGTPLRMGPGMYCWPKVSNDLYSGFIVKNGNGDTLFETSDGNFPSVVSGFAVRVPGDAADRQLNSTWTGQVSFDASYGALWNTQLIFANGEIFILLSTYGDDSHEHVYLCKLSYNSTNMNFDIVSAEHVLDAASWGDVVSTANRSYVTDDGRVSLETRYGIAAELNLSTKAINVFTSDRNNHYGMSNFMYDIGALAHSSTMITYDLWSAFSTQESYDEVRTVGLPIGSFNRNLVKSIQHLAPAADLPAIVSSNWNIGVQNRPIKGMTDAVLVLFYYYQDNDGNKQLFKNGCVFNFVTMTSKVFSTEGLYTGMPCNLAVLYPSDAILSQRQAYAVTGKTTHNGLNISTDVILIDNESKRIIGRTKSNPSTGDYVFRCWTPGKKTILAVHPVTGDLWIAAQRDPVAVG